MSPEALFNEVDAQIAAIGDAQVDLWWNFTHIFSSYTRVYFIQHGEAEFMVQGHSFIAKADDLVIIPRFTPCNLKSPDKHRQFHLSLNLPISEEFDLFDLLSLQTYHFEAIPELRLAFESLIQLFPESKLDTLNPYMQLESDVKTWAQPVQLPPSDKLKAEGSLELIFSSMMNSTNLRHKPLFQLPQLRLIYDAIQKHPEQSVSLKTLARNYGLSPLTLSRHFTRSFGCSLKQAQKTARLHQGRRLLLGTNLSINEIASKCGYLSSRAFCQLIKSETGLTPKAFRAHYGL